MVDKIISDLGANFKNGDESIIEEFVTLYGQIASNNSNRKSEDEKLYPYIYNAVKSAYIRRGNEGMTSESIGSISESYIDIEEKLANDVRNVRIMI